MILLWGKKALVLENVSLQVRYSCIRTGKTKSYMQYTKCCSISYMLKDRPIFDFWELQLLFQLQFGILFRR